MNELEKAQKVIEHALTTLSNALGFENDTRRRQIRAQLLELKYYVEVAREDSKDTDSI